MKNKSIPITLLRDTGAIDELVNSSKNPIYVTKNGYDDFMIVPKSCYEVDKEVSTKNNNLGIARVRAVSINTIKGNLSHNLKEIKDAILLAEKDDVNFLVTQELSLIGESSLDLLFQGEIINSVIEAIIELKDFSKGKNVFFCFGAPILIDNKLFNCAISVQNGTILGIIPKYNLINNRFKNDSRYFAKYDEQTTFINISGEKVLFGNDIYYSCNNDPRLTVSVEISDDISNFNSINKINKTLILNLGSHPASNAEENEIENIAKTISLVYKCSYVYCDANSNERSSAYVYKGESFIYENGINLINNFVDNKMYITTDIDIDLISSEKLNNNFYQSYKKSFYKVTFNQKLNRKKTLYREINTHPFIPAGDEINVSFAKRTIEIQTIGLANRLKSINCSKVVIGLSGGLDSALALIIVNETFKKLKISNKNIFAFSMPCFGTTNRTKSNSQKLAELIGVDFKEINISNSVEQHLKDLCVDDTNRSVAFENAQARERTQLLMDYANLIGGIVVGTGDLSELALGWCTYNGDHMSMYDTNGGVSKTLVKYLVTAYGLSHPKLKTTLSDIVGTPISPELLPGKNGNMSQLTEDIIGPYELQDFFIYNHIKYGFSPAKLHYLANIGFKNIYSNEEIIKWLKVFFKRFYISQFKRNAIPDSPRVCDIDLSPTGYLKLVSDLDYSLYLKEIEEMEKSL